MPFFAPNSTYGSDFSSYLYAVSVFFRFGWMFFGCVRCAPLGAFHVSMSREKNQSFGLVLDCLSCFARFFARISAMPPTNLLSWHSNYYTVYTQRLKCSRTEFRGSWAIAWNSTWASTAAISNFPLAVFSRAIWSRLFNKWIIASYFQLDRA